MAKQSEVKVHRVLFVKIYDDEVRVETEQGNVLTTRKLSEHASCVAWAKKRSNKVEYDT